MRVANWCPHAALNVTAKPAIVTIQCEGVTRDIER